MRIWLIRHFRTQGNLERRYIGRTDEPILPGQTGNILCCPEKIITSPMLRCKQTARLLFQKEPDLICENFREKDFGRFEGKNYEELKDDPGYQRWLDSNGTIPFPEGEGQEAFLERTRADDGASDGFAVPGSSICRTRRYDHGGFISVFSNGRRLL